MTKAGGAFFPQEVVVPLVLAHPVNHEHIRRDVLPPVVFLVEEQQVARDVDVLLLRVVGVSVAIRSIIKSRWMSVSAIGLPSEVG